MLNIFSLNIKPRFRFRRGKFLSEFRGDIPTTLKSVFQSPETIYNFEVLA